MMRVVVEHDPPGRFALDFETPRDPAEFGQRARRDRELDTEFERDRDRRQRIQRHVMARGRHGDRTEDGAGAEHLEAR